MLNRHLEVVFALEQFRVQYPRWRKETIKQILEDLVLKEIHNRMEQKYFHKKIIQTTRLGKITIESNGDIEYEIISDYESEDGFDVAAAHEEGTKRHFIKPVKKMALHWVSGYIHLFSRGHWVRGLVRNLIIEKTIKERHDMVQKKLDSETDKYFMKLVRDASYQER